MSVEGLKVLELILSKVVELSYVVLFAYIARLVANFLTRRIEVLGPAGAIFIPRLPEPETPPEN